MRIVTLLLLPLLVWATTNTATADDQSNTTTTTSAAPTATTATANERKCAFYCFFLPIKDEKIDLAPYRNLTGCTHMVYGFAEIGKNNRVESPTSYDLIPGQAFGNYRLITGLRSPSMRVLLGVRELHTSTFMKQPSTHAIVAKDIVWWARESGFDGIFLDFETRTIPSVDFRHFMRQLNQTLIEDANRYEKEGRLTLTLSLTASGVEQVHDKLMEYDSLFDSFYLLTDESNMGAEQKRAAVVDPLYPSTRVPDRDSIRWMAERITAGGIRKEKLIIGLTAWARSYQLARGQHGWHGSEVAGVGEGGNITHDSEGRLAYYELCQVNDFANNIRYDTESCSTSITDRSTHPAHWYSFNAPHHASMDRKLKWIGLHGYGGVGIISLQADDLDGVCDEGSLPLHSTVHELFKCSGHVETRPRGPPRGTQACTRLCVVNLDHVTGFSFGRLQDNWCSHIVVSSAGVLSNAALSTSDGFRQAVIEYNDWSTLAKPYLILSIGAFQSPDVWRLAIGTEQSRERLAEKTSQLLEDYNADGVDVSCLISSDNKNDPAAYNAFFVVLRKKLPKPKQIFATVTPAASFVDDFYNVTVLRSSVDYIIVQGHKFHSYNRHFTGHHSPLFSNARILNEPRNTIEGLTNYWEKKKKMPASKIIVGLSAEGMSMLFEKPNDRTDKEIGDAAEPTKVIQNRALGAGAITQTEICMLLKNSNTKRTFIEELGVPYLINGEEFIAYDDAQSMHTKSVWISLQKFGGIALHGLESDNPTGECPAGKSFNLLKTIANTQICNSCAPPPATTSNSNATDTTSPATPPLNSDCRKSFLITCNYRLPESDDDDPMEPGQIPFDKCDEIVVEEAVLDAKGELNYADGASIGHLVELAKTMKKLGGRRRLISSIRCYMSPEEFDVILDQRRPLKDKLMEHMGLYGFSGVEFRCNHLIRPKNKRSFTNLITELSAAFEKEEVSCPKTISVRIPVWETQLKKNYDIQVLNRMHMVVLESFQISQPLDGKGKNQTQLLSPLFLGGPQKLEQHSIDSTLHQWLNAGVKRDVILLHIPTYGILQKLLNTEVGNKLGAIVSNSTNIQVLPQKRICKLMQVPGVDSHIMFDAVSAYTTTHDMEWISFETNQTVAYKMKYVIRERLAGVGIATINDDDREGDCHNGKFPLLQTVLNNKCAKD